MNATKGDGATPQAIEGLVAAAVELRQEVRAVLAACRGDAHWRGLLVSVVEGWRQADAERRAALEEVRLLREGAAALRATVESQGDLIKRLESVDLDREGQLEQAVRDHARALERIAELERSLLALKAVGADPLDDAPVGTTFRVRRLGDCWEADMTLGSGASFMPRRDTLPELTAEVLARARALSREESALWRHRGGDLGPKAG